MAFNSVTISEFNLNDEASVSTVLMWILIVLLAMIVISLVFILFRNLTSDNSMFYSDKRAINLRLGKVPDIRIATKNCRDFMVRVEENKMTLSYANPFGGVKSFECMIVGDPVKEPFTLHLTELDFKKFCFNVKPGQVAIYPNRVSFNYNTSVKAKLKYDKKEV